MPGGRGGQEGEEQERERMGSNHAGYDLIPGRWFVSVVREPGR